MEERKREMVHLRVCTALDCICTAFARLSHGNEELTRIIIEMPFQGPSLMMTADEVERNEKFPTLNSDERTRRFI